MATETRIVDNRVFLLGLDELYRRAIQKHEAGELLECARHIAGDLHLDPAEVPVEGYYTESDELAEFFRLVRALQTTLASRISEISHTAEFERLRQVTGSRLFGIQRESDFLLPQGTDAMTLALEITVPKWNIESLVDAAHEIAIDSDDYSLVTLAALAKDAVVLAALRESAVLYSLMAALGGSMETIEYEWRVDDAVQARAHQFVHEFNDLFNETLPAPTPEHAGQFWSAFESSEIYGRCVRLGFDDRGEDFIYYHWAIDLDSNGKYVVSDFWDDEVWTTERYRGDSGTSLIH